MYVDEITLAKEFIYNILVHRKVTCSFGKGRK